MHADTGIHTAGKPNIEVHMGSELALDVGQAREAWDTVYDNMVGQDHMVEPATTTTARVP